MRRVDSSHAPNALGRAWRAFVAAALVASAGLAVAQEEESDPEAALPIYERTPHDVIELTPEHGRFRMVVDPLDFPARRVPVDPPPGETLEFTIQQYPGERYEVSWRSIGRIELFEDLVLAEAMRLSRAGEFDAAFDHFSYLLGLRNRPIEFDQAIDEFVKAYAASLHRQGRHEEALSLLLQLHAMAPTTQGLPGAASRTIAELVDQRLAAGEWFAARRLLLDAKSRFAGAALPEIDRRLDDLKRRADTALGQVVAAAGDQRWLDAFTAIREAAAYWPFGEPYLRWSQIVAQRYPAAVVGVTTPAPEYPTPTAAGVDWAAARSLRLVTRLPCEFERAGSEGGAYRQSWVRIEATAGEEACQAMLDPAAVDAGIDGFAFSSLLLAGAEDHADPVLAAGLQRVEATPGAVSLRIRPSLAPLGEFRLAPPSRPAAFWGPLRTALAPYLRTSGGGETTFVGNPRYFADGERRLAAVVEKKFRTRAAALAALVRGEIDAVDRIAYADLARAKQEPNLQILRYGPPRIHALAFNPRSTEPLIGDRTFRRALAYGIDCEAILRYDVLAGADGGPSRVVSGPFPLGESADDPLGYAYDRTVEPRIHNRRLATTLVRLAALRQKLRDQPAESNGDLAEQEPASDETEEDDKAAAAPAPIELPTLRIVRPADDVAAIACDRVADAWRRLGLTVEYVDRDESGVDSDGATTWDVRYVELAMWDPLHDARRLLSRDGALGLSNDFVELALDRVAAAESWQAARTALYEVHRLVQADASLIPLWQMYEFAAVRRPLEGVSAGVPSLYHDVESWRPPLPTTEGAAP